MSDIFIAYKHEDEQRVAALHQFLKAAGLDVWRDREIQGDEQWRKRIQSELEHAKCVLVVWSETSIGENNDFVMDEANRGKRRGVLVQVKVDDVTLPLGFGEHQCFDLVGWRADVESSRVQELIDVVKLRIASGPSCAPGGNEEAIRSRTMADAGSAFNMSRLGLMYEMGQNGLPKDKVQAVNWYRKAAEAGNGRGMACLGLMHENGQGGLQKDEVQAVNWYRKAAEAGDGHGMTYLGLMYKNGLGGLPKDDAQAVNWYHKAAEAGDGRGMAYLGFMYENGRGGLLKDDAQAVNWYRKAAETGESHAMHYLARMYEEGQIGLPNDKAQAVTWYRKAAEAGDEHAMTYLGIRRAIGWSSTLPKDDSLAVSWFRKGADNGDEYGMTCLGVMYASGRGGLPKDGVMAVRWYRKAAEAGDGRGMAYLGLMYENGLGGLPKDEAQAVSWYRKAAEAGDKRCMALLALMYDGGRGGLPKDHSCALRLLREAEKHDFYAQYILSYLHLRRFITFLRGSIHFPVLASVVMASSLPILMLDVLPYSWRDFDTLNRLFLILIQPAIAGFGVYIFLFKQTVSISLYWRILFGIAIVNSAVFYLLVQRQETSLSFILGFGLFFARDRFSSKAKREQPIGGEAVTIL